MILALSKNFPLKFTHRSVFLTRMPDVSLSHSLCLFPVQLAKSTLFLLLSFLLYDFNKLFCQATAVGRAARTLTSTTSTPSSTRSSDRFNGSFGESRSGSTRSKFLPGRSRRPGSSTWRSTFTVKPTSWSSLGRLLAKTMTTVTVSRFMP